MQSGLPHCAVIFFHPDYTVGFGITPNHALRLVGCTTGGELHPALKIFIQLRRKYNMAVCGLQGRFANRDKTGTGTILQNKQNLRLANLKQAGFPNI